VREERKQGRKGKKMEGEKEGFNLKQYKMLIKTQIQALNLNLKK
jgi:hypothetical protein